MSKAVTFEMDPDLRDRLKRQAAKSDLTFKAYCNAVLSAAADQEVVVQFELVPRAANFSDRPEAPEVDG